MSQRSQENEIKNNTNKSKRPWWKKGGRVVVTGLLVIFIVLFLLLLFVRSPWGQDIIVNKATKYVANKTQTEVAIDKLFITFSGKLDLQGLYLADQKGDTLLYSKELEVAIPLWPIIKGKPISINRVNWEGLRANIYRKDTITEFNYQFLIDAFVTDTEDETLQDESRPDTSDQSSPNIDIGRIDFTDFKINYIDCVSGMKAHINLGRFHFQGKNIDLNQMQFGIRAINLKNTTIAYEQTKPFPPTEEDTTTSSMPLLSVDKLKLEDVGIHYKSVPDSMEANAQLAKFLVKLPQADLTNHTIDLEKLALEKSTIAFITRGNDRSEVSEKAPSSSDDSSVDEFSWPDWSVKIHSIVLDENNLLYQNGEKPVDHNQFNPDYIDLKNFGLSLEGLTISDKETLKADFKSLSFRETGGFVLKNLGFLLHLDDKNLTIDDFNVKTKNSVLSAALNAQYDSVKDLVNKPENSTINLKLSDFSIDLADAFIFQPTLKSNEYLKALSRKKITGQLKAQGKLTDMNLHKFAVNWGPQTYFRAQGKFKNIMDPDQLYFAVNHLIFETRRADVVQLMPEENIGVSIPDTIQLQSQLHGRLNDLKTQTLLKIPEGQIVLNGQYSDHNQMAFDLDLAVNELNLGEILQNPEIGFIDFQSTASGQGSSLENLTADLKTEFNRLEYNDYDYSALNIDGHLDQGKGKTQISYNDDNLILDISSKIQLDSLQQKIATAIDLEGIDLYALNLMNKKVRGRLIMDLDFQNNKGNLILGSHISKGEAAYDDSVYHLGKLDFSGLIKQDSTSFDINSNFLNGKLRSNANPEVISNALGQQLKRYFADSTALAVTDTVKHPVRLDLEMTVSQNELINKIFIPEVQEMDTLDLSIDFNQQKKLLTVDMYLPYLDYADNIIDDLYFQLNSSVDAGQFIFGFENLDAGAFGMHRTFFNGDLADKKLTLNFYAFDQDQEKFYSMHSEITGEDKNLKIHLLPYDLIADNQTWTIPENNQLVIHKDSITAENFILSHENRSLKIANDLFSIKRDNIGISFKNFKLKSVLALFNPDDHLATGDLQGKLVAVHPFGALGVLADFGIDDLALLQVPLGDLHLKAIAKEMDKYGFKMNLIGDDVDLDLKGRYLAAEEKDTVNSKLNLDLALNKFGFKTISKFSQGQLEDGTGYLSGDFSVKGELPDPEYEGELKFNDAGFSVAQLNSSFHFTEDQIELNNKGLYFNNFSIEDADQDKFYIDGAILTEELLDPEFDLTLATNDFQLMNSTAEDNELFYGIINLDLDGTITGKMSFPKVDLNIDINKETDFTYLYSESQAALEKQEGIVEFVNKDQPEDFLTQKTDSTQNNVQLTGMDLQAKINIDKEAAFGVIMDPQTGDKLEISGEGALDFGIAENGAMSLSGSYVVNDGYYKISLYNLVKRKFDFKSGSTISWNGQPTDANLDVTAIYSVETSASDLMASQVSGASAEERNRYKQRLPFLVDLNVDGTIDSPEISFGLNMPEDSKGAMGGAVYARINQLNQDEGELNKQVFSLLVMNRFFPASGSDGSGGGFSSIARDNLNQALSDQLNQFSDQLMGNTGVKLNFGLDSYTDYQGESSQQRTDLDITAEKSLFNDRLVVKAGTDVNVQGDARPGEENPLLGNVSVEYLLTKDGRWRIRGFRKNEYENVIDGQVYINGIGLMFQRQFNKFSELWHSFFGGLKEDEEQQRKQKRATSNVKASSQENQTENSKKEQD